jgi:hypothetical protein
MSQDQSKSNDYAPMNSIEENLTVFQRKIFRVKAYNEVGGPKDTKGAYSLSMANDGDPKNKSGYSFGWGQWDLNQQGRESVPGKIINDAVNNIDDQALKHRAQINGINIDNVDNYKNELVKTIIKTKRESNPTVTKFKDLIDAELAKMSERIDKDTVKLMIELDECVKDTINQVKKPSSRVFLETNEAARLFISDLKNQHGQRRVNSLIAFLNSGQVTIDEQSRDKHHKLIWVPGATVKTSGSEFGFEELLMFRLSTQYGKDHPVDIVRRFANIVKVVKVKNISLTMEDARFFADELPKPIWTKNKYNKVIKHKQFRELTIIANMKVGKKPPALSIPKPRTNKKYVDPASASKLHPHAAEISAWYQRDYYNSKVWNIPSSYYWRIGPFSEN